MTPANTNALEKDSNQQANSNQKGRPMNKLLNTHRAAVSLLALAMAMSSVANAYATINNTVTATGSPPVGLDVTNTADETVDVEDAAPSVSVTKIANDDTDVAVGQIVTYTYTVTNNGNQTLTNVTLSDEQEGAGLNPVPTLIASPLTDNGTIGDSPDGGTDDIWDTLAPGDVVTWNGTYTVTQSDLNSNGIDNNGIMTNTLTYTASSPAAVGDVTGTVDETIDLEDLTPSLLVTKVADDDTDVVVGQVVTYTYVVTNNGNVPLDTVGLGDNITAGSGADPTPTYVSLANTSTFSVYTAGNTIDLLYMGDSATFTGTYTVTQSDVDTLQ